VRATGRGRRRAALAAAAAAALAASLASCAASEDDAARQGPRSATPPTDTAADSATTSPGATASSGPSSSADTVPLVVAHHPSRGRLSLTAGQVRDLADGSVTDWRGLGGQPGPLRVGSLAEVRRNRDTVALVPVTRVGPEVSVAKVDGVDPLRRPGPATQDAVTTVTVTGDVMLGRRVGARLQAVGDPAAALRPTARRLAAADLTLGNLEGTLSKAGPPQQGGDSFGAAPSVRAGLRLAGFDVLSMANNHAGDYGPRALVETVRRVRAGGFEPLGAGPDLAAAARPVVVERNGTTFGLVAFDAIGETPAATRARPGVLRLRMQPRTGDLDRGDLDRVTGIVSDLAARVDVVMALPHWGAQYTHRTVRDQRRVARALVRAGADVVVGGHPHWVQGVEAVRGGLVAYSLGNFVFDMDFSRKTQEGVLLEMVFWGDELKGARLVPYVIGSDFAPRIARGARGEGILDDVWSASGAPLRGTHAP
jgi:poly-gamma-glutamate synthesis protein (capsule biosynthesis protein)